MLAYRLSCFAGISSQFVLSQVSVSEVGVATGVALTSQGGVTSHTSQEGSV